MRRRLTLVSGVVLLATVAVATAAGGAWDLSPGNVDLPAVPIPAPTNPPPPPPQPVPTPQQLTTGDTTALTWTVGVIAALLAAALLTLAITWLVRQARRWNRARTPEPTEPPPAAPPGPATTATVPALADAVDTALARLDDAATPHDAVIAAWVSLEETAADHGWERHRSDTATEYTAHLLDVSPAPPEPAATLRRLYQLARFTHHPVTSAQVAHARTALQVIARSLDTPPETASTP